MTASQISLEQMPEASGSIVDQKRQKRYCLTGIADEATALNWALNWIPIYLTNEALFRQNIKQSSSGADLYYFDVDYGPVPLFSGTYRVAFDTTGGNIHINYSLECVNSYSVETDPTKLGEFIDSRPVVGQRSDGMIEGTERIIPMAKRTYTFRWPKGIVTESYMDYIEVLTGVVNSVAWHGRPAGEVLFVGARGSAGLPPSECDLSYEMLLMPNVTNQTYGIDPAVHATFGQLTGIDKKGHEFLDVIFQDAANSGDAGKTLKGIRVHRMYETLDFAKYLGF